MNIEIDVDQADLDRLGIKLDEEQTEESSAEPEGSEVVAPAETEPAGAAEQAELDYAKELEDIRKELAALKPPERHPAEAEPQPENQETEEQQASRLAKELADELGDDAAIVPKLAQKVVSIAGKLGSQVEQLARKQQEVDARQARLDAIETNQKFWQAVSVSHVDAKDLVDEEKNVPKGKLADWIASQPEGLRGVYGRIVSEGTASELSALLELAKKTFAVAKGYSSTPDDLGAKKAAVEQKIAALKDKKGPDLSVSEAPPVIADRPLHERVKESSDPVGLIRSLTGNDPAKFRKTAESLLFD